MRRMRWLLCGLLMLGAAQQARAADFGEGFLRGSSTVIAAPSCCQRWDGIYFGGHVGWVNAGADFSRATTSLLDFMLRDSRFITEARVSEWDVLAKNDTTGLSYGAFLGYNMVWEGAIVGIEGTYNRTNMQLSSTESIGRQPAGFSDNVYIDGSASVRLTDYGTIRARGGWDAGRFMPYGFLGVAIGRADVSRSATVNLLDPTRSPFPYFTETRSEAKQGSFAYGYAAGVGVDFALMNNFFVRAEYEYVHFGSFHDINLHLHTARVGAAVKF